MNAPFGETERSDSPEDRCLFSECVKRPRRDVVGLYSEVGDILGVVVLTVLFSLW